MANLSSLELTRGTGQQTLDETLPSVWEVNGLPIHAAVGVPVPAVSQVPRGGGGALADRLAWHGAPLIADPSIVKHLAAVLRGVWTGQDRTQRTPVPRCTTCVMKARISNFRQWMTQLPVWHWRNCITRGFSCLYRTRSSTVTTHEQSITLYIDHKRYLENLICTHI